MSEQFDTAELQDANLIIYGVKFPWDKPEDTIHMLGQQAATSTTDTPTLTAVVTKKNTFHASGTRAETFVVDSYWKKRNDYIREGIQRSVKENRTISLWRIDFNQKTADPAHPGKFVVPATYAQCYANGMPNTEAVNNLNHANITDEVNGSSSEGELRQDELAQAALLFYAIQTWIKICTRLDWTWQRLPTTPTSVARPIQSQHHWTNT